MTSIHNIANDLETADFPSAWRMAKTPEGYHLGGGKTVGNGVENWAPGAMFVHADGSGQTLAYKNIGTATTADFQPLSNNQTARGSIVIPITALTLEDGTAIGKFSNGASATPGFSQESNKELVLRWNNHASPTKVATNILTPRDIDDSKDLIVSWLAKVSGSTDTPLLEHECYFNAGDTDCAGTDAEVTSTSVLPKTATIVAADIPSTRAALTVIFGPKGGELGTDDFLVYGFWLQYTRKPQIA